MEEYTITNEVEPGSQAPMDLIQSIWMGNGGTIHIEPGARPAKILFELKQLLRGLAIGFQWHNVTKLKAKGMHGEYAEAHVTQMLNKLVSAEVPPIPSEEELAKIREIVEERDGQKDGSGNQVPEQDIT